MTSPTIEAERCRPGRQFPKADPRSVGQFRSPRELRRSALPDAIRDKVARDKRADSRRDFCEIEGSIFAAVEGEPHER